MSEGLDSQSGRETRYQRPPVSAHDFDDLKPLDERFQVTGKPMCGGMGVVFPARELTETGSISVAIKRIRPELAGDQLLLERFRREARAMMQIRHYGIVHVRHLLEDSRGPLIVMDWIEGQTLAALLSKAGCLDSARALQIIRQVAIAMSAAHQHGAIHRDIKPGNILLDLQERAYVTDFGLVRIAEESTGGGETVTGALLGTARYTAPEQEANSRNATEASDIFSLGATLLELVTGASPRAFEMDRVLPALVPVIQRALRNDPRQRFASMLEFAEACDAALLALRPSPDRPGTGSNSERKSETESETLVATCGRCGTKNPTSRKFCLSCGSGLTESCLSERCGKKISSGEKFCPECGVNLQELTARREQQYEQILEAIQQALTAYDFPEATRQLKSLSQNPHPKFVRYQEKATALESEIAGRRRDSESQIRNVLNQGARLLKQDAVDDVIQLVDDLPPELVDRRLTFFGDTPAKIRQRAMDRKDELAREQREQLNAKRQSVQQVLAEARQLSRRGDLPAALRVLEGLTNLTSDELQPERAAVESLRIELRDEQTRTENERAALLAQAQELALQHRYQQAASLLETIPTPFRSAEVESLRKVLASTVEKINNVLKSAEETTQKARVFSDNADFRGAMQCLESFLNDFDRSISMVPEVEQKLNALQALRTSLMQEAQQSTRTAEQHLNRAQQLIHSGDWPASISLLANIPITHRQTAWNLLRDEVLQLGVAQAEADTRACRFERSSTLLSSLLVLANSTTKPTDQELQTRAAHQSQLHNDAIQLLNYWKQIDQEVLLRQPWRPDVVRNLERLIQLFPDHPDRKSWKQVQAKLRRNESNRLTRQAVELAMENPGTEDPHANELFQQARELDPQNPHAFRESSRFTNDLRKSSQWSAEAVRLGPADARNWLQRGRLRIAASPANAIDDLSRAVELAATEDIRIGALSLRAEAHLRNGNYQAAIEDVTTCLRSGDAPEWFEQRARIHAAFDQFDAAIADNTTAAALRHQNSEYSKEEYLKQLNRQLKARKRNQR